MSNLEFTFEVAGSLAAAAAMFLEPWSNAVVSYGVVSYTQLTQCQWHCNVGFRAGLSIIQ